ncbi:hypothetical protein KUCAC02_010113 [Chaenocephalus aceratus]|uniref:Uncharacterized protein n=1 Tax=Chaenocephalus aceratus TaxID=36190 RepID=A0ACB9VZD1_CHAAC|nr:hypothetical protein KUCAC02_010113 [Chaenocephalus aceratus]
MDTTPAKLRIIFEHNDIRKLVLPSGIPRTLEELICELQEAFHIPGEFTVMYQDMDFDGQFCTLSCIEDVEDKGTLKQNNLLTTPLATHLDLRTPSCSLPLEHLTGPNCGQLSFKYLLFLMM